MPVAPPPQRVIGRGLMLALPTAAAGTGPHGGQAVCDTGSAEIAAGPAAHPVCGMFGEAAVVCQAVLHMDRQFGVPAAHRASSNVTAYATPQIAVELTVDERVDVAAVAKMTEVHHAGGNPTSTQMLPTE